MTGSDSADDSADNLKLVTRLGARLSYGHIVSSRAHMGTGVLLMGVAVRY